MINFLSSGRFFLHALIDISLPSPPVSPAALFAVSPTMLIVPLFTVPTGPPLA